VKYIYHIPPSHFLCVGRLWVVGLLTVNAVKEYYDFMRFRAKFRKVTILLFISIVTMEILIVLTQGHGPSLIIQTSSTTPTSTALASSSSAGSSPSS
jgi:hypothetical protein